MFMVLKHTYKKSISQGDFSFAFAHFGAMFVTCSPKNELHPKRNKSSDSHGNSGIRKKISSFHEKPCTAA